MTASAQLRSNRGTGLTRLMRAGVGAGLLAVLVVTVSSGLAMTSYAVTTMVTAGLIYLIAALGLSVFSGNSGVLSFASAGFLAVGAYTAGILSMPTGVRKAALPLLPEWLASIHTGPTTAVLIAGAVTLVLGLVVALPIARLDGAAAVIATISILIIIHVVLIGASDFTRGSQTFYGVPRTASYPVVLAFAVVAVVIARVFRDTPAGLQLRASRDDQLAAAAIGVRVGRQRIIGWLLGAALSGMAGGLLGQFLGAFSPKQFYFTMTMTIIAMMVVGGMNTVTGAILGAGVVTVMVNVLRGLEGGGQIAGVSVPQFFGLTDAGLALVLLLTMIIRPQGIVPHFEIDEWLGRLLTRRRPAAEPSPIDWTRLSSEQPVKLEFSEIRKAFAGVQALDGVSFSLCSGEIVGLIGANGSGKSTLVNVVTGVTGMDSGAVRLDGQELAGLSSAEIARRGLARTFQNIRLFSGLTVQDNVAVAAVASGQDWDLGLVLTSDEQLLGLRDRLATTLSYGDQRRVEIARTLATRPKFALLDEPAAGMNVEESEALAERLRQLVEQTGIGILIVDHDMRMMARLCDRLVVLDHGSLITHGHPTEVLTDPRVAELYLGSAAQGLVDERMKTTSNPSKED